MFAMLALVFSAFFNLSLAEPIVIDAQRLNVLSKQLRENKYYIKRGPAKFEIFYFDIGKAQTPFFEQGQLTKRFYQNENKCFELTVYEKANIARRVRCIDKLLDLYLPGKEDFKVTKVDDLLSQGLTSFRIGEFENTFDMEAYIQDNETFTADQDAYGDQIRHLAPKQKFQTTLSGFLQVTLKEKTLELNQELKLKVGKIGFISEKIKLIQNTIRIKNGGIIFSNGRGQVLIYNPYLPKPFGDYELNLNSKLPELLGQMAEESISAPACFRDNYYSPGAKDCHKLIFDGQSLGNFSEVKIVHLDFINHKVEFSK